MAVKVEVKDAVYNLGKNVAFLQPLYEAITNSLEANASAIKVILYSEDSLFEYGKITGYDVIDNGEGFTEENLNGFKTLWTDNKRNIGCKGSGRFTWLSVFEDVHIVSLLSKEKRQVEFDFNYNFDYDATEISEKMCESSNNSTEIRFRNIKRQYMQKNTKKGIIDKREFADPLEIKDKIIDYLLVKLFLLKKQGRKFEIIISSNNNEAKIIEEDIPNLSEKEFNVTSDFSGETYKFLAYYLFEKDNKNSKRMIFCSNNRSTKVFDGGQLGFSAPLPEQDSFTILICSDYFENKDNDSRSNFDELSNLKTPTLFAPLLITDIFKEAKCTMKQIIEEHYPNVAEINAKAESDAIELFPFLSKYIKEDEEITKSTKSLISNANKKFNKEKDVVRENFDRALKNKDVDSKAFKKAVDDISLIAAIELSEYIHYRDNIIRALLENLGDEKYKEEFYHNIIIPKGFESESIENRHLSSNLWLIDDKFMTYSYVGSDISINRIVKNNSGTNHAVVPSINRPDATLIFNGKEGYKDCVMIEFKGANATFEEKNKSITELPIDISLLRKNMEDLQTMWGYIVTSIDDKFEETLLTLDYKPLFVSGAVNKMYYRFHEKINSHIYVCDFETIAKDAEARNKTFLNILRQK